MADVVPFTPKSSSSSVENMRDFVAFCRKLHVYGADLDFDSYDWDLTDFYLTRGRNHKHWLHFREFGVRGKAYAPPMPEPFAEQAKAFVRYQNGISPKRMVPVPLLSAFKSLLDAFVDLGIRPDLTSINAQLLDRAVALTVDRTNNDFAARTGVLLANINNFLREKRLAVYAPIAWKHGLLWHSLPNRLKDAEAKRKKHLPSNEALNAIPEAFKRAKSPKDVIITSCIALLTCAPSRINEIFGLPVDCEIAPLREEDQNYMLRWAGSKGFGEFAKGIPAVMAEVAKQAIERITACTNEAREIAKWYEENPNQLYLPPECLHLRGADLTVDQIRKIVGFDDDSLTRNWLRARKLTPTLESNPNRKARNKGNRYHFADLEKLVLGYLPRGFPILDPQTGLKYSEALMVARRYEFNNDGTFRWRCMIEPITYSHIQQSFISNIFARLGISASDRPIELRSHQLRHYLNTLAQRGGLSEVEIAAWSGRKDIRQNAVYDHRTEEEKRHRKVERDKAVGLVANPAANINAPVARSLSLKIRHGHVTEIGFCEHDFSASPCAMFMECLKCVKHTCVKGHDIDHIGRVKSALKYANASFAEAERANFDSYDGADEWMSSHRETIQRLEELLKILSDPDVPDGSVIRLSKSGRLSLFEQARNDAETAGHLLFQTPVSASLT